ncbi:rod shape-determining protein MreD [Bacillus sp. 2205SS5-2]|uniref:rod shape-determining protein MreD n=1 Tax=Bacillus sp. 2205SS5-2 TaxID=3109031 RepID=UPI00300580EC
MRRFVLPIVATLIFYSESLFVQLFSSEIFGQHGVVVPHFLLILLLFIGIYKGQKTGFVYAIIFGFLFDFYFTGIIGIYLYLFPIVVYLVSQIMKLFDANVIVTSIVSFLGIILMDFAVFELYSLLQKTSLSHTQFVEWRLLPTMIVNAIALILMSMPLKTLLLKLKKIQEEE